MNKKTTFLTNRPIDLRIHEGSTEKERAISLQAEIRARAQKGCCPQTFYDNSFNVFMASAPSEKIAIWIEQYRHYNSLPESGKCRSEWLDARKSNFLTEQKRYFVYA